MRRYCAQRQQRIVHGLGLVLKNPKTDYMRGNMLSKNFGIYKGRVVMTRMPEKILLTASMQPQTLTS